FACLTWPKEYGGAGLTSLHEVIWAQEVENYETRDSHFVIGVGNCGPAIMHFAAEEARHQLLPRMASAEDVWCQLFSEPCAGSDVAGLRTRAERDGDNWLINGQKIWTSGAQHSDYGVVLTRTDPTVSKYRGLTLFMIDMRQSGVEVRPIKQMDGGQHFNEVFFNDAVVPDNYRLGEVGGGWTGALTVLMSERLAISGIQPTGFPQFLDLVKSLELNGEPIANDPVVRERLATWYSQYAGLQSVNKRMITAVAKGGIAGAEASMGKLVGAVMNQEIANFACQLFGQAGIIQDESLSPEQAHFQETVLFSPGVRLAGGTDEVMRNILAEQVLGLPQEPRADKGMAFQDIPTGPT
ncbi:MAG: acyl-CoA dehydrogenase, partial [Gammaproteobacteria bacterium]|nr:acyl-CoA dehydrogenase [Gammaproteobacteria bacterium]